MEVKGGGKLESHRSIKMTGGKHEILPIMRATDQADLFNYAYKNGFDFVAIPYAVRKKDIQTVRDYLGPAGAHIKLLAKIDTLEAIHNFEDLINAADGIIINRVEIGLELPPEKLMLAEKWMIDRTNQEGKPVFVQSQVLESMTSNG